MMFASEVMDKITMINMLVPQENLIVGGQPTINDLRTMKLMGISQVINLRPTTEIIDFDEVELLHNLDMNYHLIPLTDITTFTKGSAQQLEAILDLNEPTLVHCASGNRVGALIALQAFWCDQLSPQESLDKGLQAGLTKLTPQVSELLGL
jgi:protein tyrosine phosphatase (PTP) superfamily phosphohydrolase (DUF442 family)